MMNSWAANRTLAGLPLEALRAQYRDDLFTRFLPFVNQYVVDHQYGGFMCNTDADGNHLNEEKDCWFMGRGIWVYSFLYRHFGENPEHLTIARRGVEFILGIKPGSGQLWPRIAARDGACRKPGTDIYGDLFIAEGLVEYSRATDSRAYMDEAREIVLKCKRIYDRPDYHPNVLAAYGGPKVLRRRGATGADVSAAGKGPRAVPFPGARSQGVSMVLIRVISQMLESGSDVMLEALLSECIDLVLNRHYDPELRLNIELLNHDYSRPDNEIAQFVSLGHAIETMWFIMQEAVRRGAGQLFDLAAARFRRHVDVAWDDIYGGHFRNLISVDENIWSLDKALWLQEEVLVGSLLMLEETGDRWAHETFSRTYQYVGEKFRLRERPCPGWIWLADRKVTPDSHATWVEIYHHPRHLMLNLLRIERMMGM